MLQIEHLPPSPLSLHFDRDINFTIVQQAADRHPSLPMAGVWEVMGALEKAGVGFPLALEGIEDGIIHVLPSYGKEVLLPSSADAPPQPHTLHWSMIEPAETAGSLLRLLALPTGIVEVTIDDIPEDPSGLYIVRHHSKPNVITAPYALTISEEVREAREVTGNDAQNRILTQLALGAQALA